jgi:DNA replication protein DnaC
MDECPYRECDGDGFVVDEATNTALPCRCRGERQAARRARAVEGRLRRAIPKRYRDLSFDRHPLNEVALLHPTASATVRAFAASISSNIADGKGLWLAGDKGTGKTSLAYLVSATAARAGHTVLVWNTVDLMNDLRRSFDPSSPHATSDIVEAACTVDLLQLEDLSAARPTEWVLEQLYLIVNRRYEEERTLICTSDMDEGDSPYDLEDQVGARTISRILGTCELVPLKGEDMRLKGAAA